MCRIVGVLSKTVDGELLERMRDTMEYGGPDDKGIYIDKIDGIGLGHRRLSILDTSKAGLQPMQWNSLVIVYNGEIYNFKEISNELITLGYTFISGSDTEVILKSFECWGYDAVHKFRGMFAFAIWNTDSKKLTICRDRVGVKPLYWYLNNDVFMFSSELKAFFEHPKFEKSINHDAVSLFLKTGYIRSPLSIFEHVQKLMPGNFLEIDQNLEARTWNYWNVREIYNNSEMDFKSDADYLEECEEIISESFNLRMVSDVPVGLFLSGGIDSSLVTSIIQKTTAQPLNTFTIGFENEKFNESTYAKDISKHLGTNHTELICTEKDFEKIIDQLPFAYDEPFGDSSSIPTLMVSELARKKVKVSLSADGGDELFTGYNRYLFADQLFNKLNYVPAFLKNMGISLLEKLDYRTIHYIQKIIPQINDSRITKGVEALKSKNKIEFLYAATQYISDWKLKKLHLNNSFETIFDKSINIKMNQEYGAFGVVDIESYLEGDILTKVDRATMQFGLEGREPFLDHKLIEYALTLPDHLKLRNGETKWILKQILNKYVPQSLLDRPKMGFGIPLDIWLRTMLKEEIIKMSNDSDFTSRFRLSPIFLQELVNSYLLKRNISAYFIWNLYCLFAWHKKWSF